MKLHNDIHDRVHRVIAELKTIHDRTRQQPLDAEFVAIVTADMAIIQRWSQIIRTELMTGEPQ